jgi:ribose 5-phosphate isomerase B
MKIALATDHAGFEQVKALQAYLESLGNECHYYGPEVYDEADDYPDFIFAAARAVANGECERGIVFGSSGQGEAMAANRLTGVRCALFYGPVVAPGAIDAEGSTSSDPYILLRLSREHNDANMLSLAARFLSMDEIQTACKVWLDAPGATAERHLRRVKKLDSLA